MTWLDILEELYKDSWNQGLQRYRAPLAFRGMGRMLNTFPTLKAFDESSRKPFVVFLAPPALDARILNQLALFSLMSSPSARLDDWLAAHPTVCRRVRIPADLKWEIGEKLDQANVNDEQRSLT